MFAMNRSQQETLSSESYRCYLYFSAVHHPDGFMAPSDWLKTWNLQQWMLDPRSRLFPLQTTTAALGERNPRGME